MRITIEPAGDGEFSGYAHGRYGRSSVLAGQARRQWLGSYKTLAEAVEAHPTADVLEGSTKPWRDPNASLEELSGLPECPPSWFDPSAAGETW